VPRSTKHSRKKQKTVASSPPSDEDPNDQAGPSNVSPPLPDINSENLGGPSHTSPLPLSDDKSSDDESSDIERWENFCTMNWDTPDLDVISAAEQIPGPDNETDQIIAEYIDGHFEIESVTGEEDVQEGDIENNLGAVVNNIRSELYENCRVKAQIRVIGSIPGRFVFSRF